MSKKNLKEINTKINNNHINMYIIICKIILYDLDLLI